MATPSEINDSINTDAEAGIQRTQVGSESVDLIPLKDRIAAADRAAANQAAAADRPGLGWRFQRAVPKYY